MSIKGEYIMENNNQLAALTETDVLVNEGMTPAPSHELADVSNVDTLEPKIIVCYPIIAGNGGKHTAAMLAHKYKELYPNKKIALVDLDFHHPHFMERFISASSRHGIDNLLDHIDGDNLPNHVFLENMVTLKSGVDYLKGTNLGDKHIFICKNHIESILKHLRSNYDKVFVSTASAFDNSGTIYGINGADEVILIVKNNYSNLRKIEDVYPEVMRYYFQERPLKVIINQYNSVSGFSLGNFLSKNHVEGLGAVPFQAETCDAANLMKNKLLNVNLDIKRKRNERDYYKEILEKLFTLPTESK